MLGSARRGAEGHGRLMDPPARNSMWRFGFPNPVNYNDNELFCGGYAGMYAKKQRFWRIILHSAVAVPSTRRPHWRELCLKFHWVMITARWPTSCQNLLARSGHIARRTIKRWRIKVFVTTTNQETKRLIDDIETVTGSGWLKAAQVCLSYSILLRPMSSSVQTDDDDGRPSHAHHPAYIMATPAASIWLIAEKLSPWSAFVADSHPKSIF